MATAPMTRPPARPLDWAACAALLRTTPENTERAAKRSAKKEV